MVYVTSVPSLLRGKKNEATMTQRRKLILLIQ